YDETANAAFLHAYESLVPAVDHAACTEQEAERSPIRLVGRIKQRALLIGARGIVEPALVVDGADVARRGLGPASDEQIRPIDGHARSRRRRAASTQQHRARDKHEN